MGSAIVAWLIIRDMRISRRIVTTALIRMYRQSKPNPADFVLR